MAIRTLKHDTLGRLSVFELDALREAFKRSVRENNVTEIQWAEHAELFVKSAIGEESRTLRV
ncbi:hypothetical protein EOA75_12180 [Mesorhizobium sp. M1A.F.Ca.IN.022.07.1.1]|uniref:hypothetical protein n=1 Tax=unclassified Mesorhizobium TaxID=325217 RepID=UPI000FCACB1A|nr:MULTISPECIES: hypothetical protein [unclassified Mesorhizobium]RUV94205.1 hypothetical protein EOA75_12180 [Mesorhizobium sp. M1A.F.Ca.IN.022.07.1.1]RWG00803.1 MAG: hypothetical protein EOQ54_25460 [Mesorhizobium sp.]RWH00564.1 MAG: hypothetical protein EOQ72_10550 [Mesorhizobium sp.]TIR94906.1 MAG: hypothetical protein E5X08_03675 [Mesorhizobium sp.]TIS65300.1 MAG: hypothetical protein E5X11_09145 [Mesorhizobium sp.]